MVDDDVISSRDVTWTKIESNVAKELQVVNEHVCNLMKIIRR